MTCLKGKLEKNRLCIQQLQESKDFKCEMDNCIM